MRNKIKTSLDVARTQRVSCKTTRIEEQIKKDLLGTRGSFLTANEVGKIVEKEDRRKKKTGTCNSKSPGEFTAAEGKDKNDPGSTNGDVPK
jgi:hypothetical protein